MADKGSGVGSRGGGGGGGGGGSAEATLQYWPVGEVYGVRVWEEGYGAKIKSFVHIAFLYFPLVNKRKG